MAQTFSLVSPARAIMTVVAALAIGTAVSVSPASADTLLYTNGADSGAGSVTIGTEQVADPFTLSSDATVTTITFSTWVNTGDTPSTVDWLITDSAFGSVEASGILATITAALITTGDTYNTYEATFSTGGVALAAGTYWLQLEDEDTELGGSGGWGISTLTDTAVVSVDDVQSPSPGNSFQVFGDADIPEPASLALLGAGLAGLGVVRRRRRS